MRKCRTRLGFVAFCDAEPAHPSAFAHGDAKVGYRRTIVFRKAAQVDAHVEKLTAQRKRSAFLDVNGLDERGRHAWVDRRQR